MDERRLRRCGCGGLVHFKDFNLLSPCRVWTTRLLWSNSRALTAHRLSRQARPIAGAIGVGPSAEFSTEKLSGGESSGWHCRALVNQPDLILAGRADGHLIASTVTRRCACGVACQMRKIGVWSSSATTNASKRCRPGAVVGRWAIPRTSLKWPLTRLWHVGG